ncbi:MAG: ABC transporter transmembrane domain-containing protein, partial [Anaerolineae bacterium]
MGRTDMGRWGELHEMRHFGRVLRLVWPHRTYLVVAMAAMLGVALCLTASIVSLYPVLKVVIGKESIPDFVDRLVVQDRLEGVALAVRDMTGLKLAEQVGARAVQVVQISRRDSLYKEGVRQFDYITGVAGEGVSGRVLIRRLVGAQAGESIGLTVWRTAVAAEAQVTVVPERAGRLNRTLRWAVVSLGFSEESEGVDEATWINQRKRLLVYILLVFLAVQLVGNVCRFVGEYYGAVVGTRTLLDLRRLMYSKTLMLPVEYFHVEGVSGTMGRFVQDSQDVLRALRSLFGKVLKEPMKAGGAFAVAIYMQPKLTLVLIVVSPVAALMFRQFGRRVRRANEKVL